MTDLLLETVRAYAPVADDRWSAAQATAAWSAVQRLVTSLDGPEAHVAPLHRRRRWVLTVGIVTVAAAAAMTVQAVLPTGGLLPAPASAQAAEIEQLAVTAGSLPGDVLEPGQFRHVVEGHAQTGEGSGVRQEWIRADGFRYVVDGISGPSYYQFGPGDDNVNYPSPGFLATLPTDPAALASYLRATVTGSHSNAEAVFVAVGDMLRSYGASPALRAAALRVLTTAPGVTVRMDDHTSTGRPAVALTYGERGLLRGEVLLIDPATSAVIGERATTGDGAVFYESAVRSVTVVDAVPAEVLAKAIVTN
ncbi:MAG: hypothetical protein JWM93_2176 [Frankiales bacterium]|nr:hypothetical protein [Frankiales bacterium]